MTKAELVAQLEGAKALTSVVSIDNVIALIQGLDPEVQVKKVFGITQELAEEIAERIERSLNRVADELIDLDSAEFELSYNNQIELTRADIDVDRITKHVCGVLDTFIPVPDENEDAE